MKTKIYIALTALLAGFVFNSCTSDEMEADKGSESLVLSVSSEVVELDQLMSDREAFHFAWTAGSNYGTDSRISYVLEMDLKGNNFAGGLKKDMDATDSRILAFNHKEMNDLLAEVWNSSLDETLEFEARVTAAVLGHEEFTQVSPVVTFKLTPYIERYLNLWMIGGATVGGWSLDNATPMESIEDEPNGFVWEGELGTGELKFVTQQSDFYPSFGRDGSDENKLIYRQDENDGPDNKFNIKRGASYRVKVNLNTLDIEITNLDGEEPDNSEFWMIGTAAGEMPIAMTKDDSNPELFTYNGELQDGTFRISKDKEGTEVVTEEKQMYKSKYAVTFNVGSQDLTVEQIVVYEKVWAMGEAVSGDFAWENVKELTQSNSNKNEFVYEGELGTGQIKFPLQFGDYGGLFLVAEEDNKGVYDEFTGSCYLSSDKGDNKWYMNNAGTFKVTINTYKKEIHFQKK